MVAFLRTLLAVILGIFITFFLIFFIIALVVSGTKKTISVNENSVLVLKMDGEIPERPLENPFAEFNFWGNDFKHQISLKEILDDIRFAKDDSHIKGIYIEFSGLQQPSYPTMEELRNAIIDFRKAGKFVYAYSELYTQRSYYLASAADSIFLNPNGVFSFSGFHSEQLFLKGLFEKLDIKPKLIRAGKYKSAGEMFVNSGMSDPNRQQLTDLLSQTWDYYLSKVGASRNIDPGKLKSIAENLEVKFPSDALNKHLVDKLCYEDQVLNSLCTRTGVQKTSDLESLAIEDYNDADHPKKHGDGKIALIYAVGDITGGEGNEEQIGSQKLAETIRKAREDDKIKAIVLRINSPGGSAVASDIIWREVNLAKKVKPVIASFSDVAASGGYYIAAPADFIIAEPNTITGSIGVFGVIPMLKDFWNNKLGITWDRVKTGKYADIGNPNREMTPEEEGIIQLYIDSTYLAFKTRVANGRHLTLPFVDSIAQGHVYSGIQAKKLGLVDSLGNLNDAIDMAAKKAGLSSYSIRVMPTYKMNFRKLFQSMTMIKENLVKEELKENYYILKNAETVSSMQGIMMYCPYDITIY